MIVPLIVSCPLFICEIKNQDRYSLFVLHVYMSTCSDPCFFKCSQNKYHKTNFAQKHTYNTYSMLVSLAHWHINICCKVSYIKMKKKNWNRKHTHTHAYQINHQRIKRKHNKWTHFIIFHILILILKIVQLQLE